MRLTAPDPLFRQRIIALVTAGDLVCKAFESEKVGAEQLAALNRLRDAVADINRAAARPRIIAPPPGAQR